MRRMLSDLCIARGSLPSNYICVCLMHDGQRHGKCDLQSCMARWSMVILKGAVDVHCWCACLLLLFICNAIADASVVAVAAADVLLLLLR